MKTRRKSAKVPANEKSAIDLPSGQSPVAHPLHARSLIVFAWTVELVGVACGVVNSAYVTFGNNMPATFAGWIPAIPLAALAASELLRVPLAGALVTKAGLASRALAVVALVALAGIAIENWTFGLERVVNLRLSVVQEAEAQVFEGQAHARTFEEQLKAIEKSKAGMVAEKEASIARLRVTSDRLAAEAKAAHEEHDSKLGRIFNACKIAIDKCVNRETAKENDRFAKQRQAIDDELRRTAGGIEQLEGGIGAVARDADARMAEIDTKIQEAKRGLIQREDRVQQAKEENQIYRLAGMWFGVKAGDVTLDQINKTRFFFSLFGAVAIALAGMIAALVFYSRNKVPGKRAAWHKLVNSARAWVARRRKRVVREVKVETPVDRIVEVPGPERIVYRDGKEPPIVIEKEKVVERQVEHIVLVPRFGISWPVHVNALVAKAAAGANGPGEGKPDTATVTNFSKKAG